MIELREWFRQASLSSKPWLLLGKGPSFSFLDRCDRDSYHVLGLNHVVAKTRVDVAHIIDIDVVEQCGEALLTNCLYLVMPRVPHENCAAGHRRLEEYVARIPVLKRLDSEGRLVWYNLSTSSQIGDSPVISARFFSAEAAVAMLGTVGVHKIRTLGIDGGRSYGNAFAELQQSTLLANGHSDFDCQQAGIDASVQRFEIDFAPLIEPMHIFVGTDASQTVAARVLEFTIRKHASGPVVVHPMNGADLPRPKGRKHQPRTGFSFARFNIPRLCGYRGRGLYVDADMQVFSDVAELWQIPFGEQRILCTNQPERPRAWKSAASGFHPGRQMSVMLLDCARLDWRVEDVVAGLDEERYSYEDLLFKMCLLPPEQIEDRIPPEWNCLEWFEAGKSKLTHYTVVPTQPWKNDQNDLRGVWEAGYREAVEAGAVPIGEVLAGIKSGDLKPSLVEAFSKHAVAEAIERINLKNGLRLRFEQMHRKLQRVVGKAAMNPAGLVRRVITGHWNG